MPTWNVRIPPADLFADHGAAGSGEPLAIALRQGNAGSNAAADHIEVTPLAVAQLPSCLRRRVLIRHESPLTRKGQLAAKPSKPLPALDMSIRSGSSTASSTGSELNSTPHSSRRRSQPGRMTWLVAKGDAVL